MLSPFLEIYRVDLAVQQAATFDLPLQATSSKGGRWPDFEPTHSKKRDWMQYGLMRLLGRLLVISECDTTGRA